MTTKDYREKSPLLIFLGYFKNHKKLFALEVASLFIQLLWLKLFKK